MSTEFSGIQLVALRGLLANTGMQAPDISQPLIQYKRHAAVDQYYYIEAQVAGSPASSSITNINDSQGNVALSGTYVRGQAVVVTGTASGNGSGITGGVTYYVVADSNTGNVVLTDTYDHARAGVTALSTVAGDISGLSTASYAGAPIPTSQTLVSFAGYDPTSGGAGTADWNSGTAYSGGEYVRRTGKIYLSISAGTNKDPVTETGYWTVQNITPYTVFAPAYSSLFDIKTVSWLKDSDLVVMRGSTTLVSGTDYTFSNSFSQLTLTLPPLTTETVYIKVNPRDIFYRLAEKFPAALGSTPQQFNDHWGNGNLISRAYARTAALFPNNGCTKFSHYLNQGAIYAQKTQPLIKSSAQATFGASDNPATTAAGGLNKLAGNGADDLAQVGQGLTLAGNVVDLQNPWSSFSALGLLQQLLKKGAEKTGNLHFYAIGKTVVDPATGRTVVIDSQLAEQQVAQAELNRQPLRDTGLDQAIVALISSQADSADVASIQQYFQSTATGIVRFSDLVSPEKMLGANAQAKIVAATGDQNLVRGLAQALKQHVKVTPTATASSLGNSMTQMQPVTGADLNSLTQPTTQAQFQSLLSSLGHGSGENGTFKAADCLGETNYLVVLAKTLEVVGIFGGIDSNGPLIQPLVTDMNALRKALDLGVTDTTVVTSDGSTGFASWAELLIKVKTLTDPVAASLANQVQSQGLADKLKPYNRLAETHNMSVYLYATAPFETTVNTSSDAVMGFVRSLPDIAKNQTKFDAQQLVEDCCASDLTGQAIVGSMREGRNAQALESSGISMDTGSSTARPLQVSESAPGLVGGGAWPAPRDPYASLPSTPTGA